MRRRTRIAFTLRFAMLTMVVVAAYLAFVSHNAQRQRKAVAHLVGVQAYCNFDNQLHYGEDHTSVKWKTDTSLPVPNWIADLTGEDYFRKVVSVNVEERSKFTNDDFPALGMLRGLRQINFSAQPSFDDDALKHLARLHNLDVLTFSNCSIDGSGFVHLKDLSRLTYLSFSETPICDDALSHFAQLRTLRAINLNGTKVTDEGLYKLRDTQNLDDIQIGDTSVTDAGLLHLAGLKNLKRVWARNTKITDDGVTAFQRVCPGCRVVR